MSTPAFQHLVDTVDFFVTSPGSHNSNLPLPSTPPGAPVPLPHSTPVKLDSSTRLPFTTNAKYQTAGRNARGKEMLKYVIGPMAADKFLDTFFPVNELPNLDAVPEFEPNSYHNTINHKTELHAYIPFIETSSRFAPDLKFVDSHTSNDCNPHKDRILGVKPDVCVYRASDTGVTGTDSTKLEIAIEFKWTETEDPFLPKYREESQFSGLSEAAFDTLGQITDYAATQLSAQFRTHIYSVLIVKQTATILRWDRAGTIITQPIDYNNSPHLAEFFRRYSCASPAMRGMDQSVSEPTLAEAAAAKQALGLGENARVFKLEVPGAGHASRYYITGAPTASLYTPPGRGTRVFHAYSIAEGKKFLLKDSWRVDLPDIQPEGQTYEVLNTAKVRNIPTCLSSGDINTDKYHVTVTNKYNSSPPNSQFIPHQHYRLVLDIIGSPLTKFASSHEMVTAVRDALVAHMDAYEVGILHRDISPGNIVIYKGHGLLIDWDLSKPVKSPSTGVETPRRATRTGTWQFMSCKLISQPVWQHDFRDDLESSIYVLLWVMFMYSTCSQPNQAIPFLDNVLDPQPHAKGTGYTKSDFLRGRTLLEEVKFTGRPKFDDLLVSLAKLFASRYESIVPKDKLPPETPESLDDRNMIKAKNVVIRRMTNKLENHDATIQYFNDALEDRLQWPAADGAVDQGIRVRNENNLVSTPVVRANWNSDVHMVV